MGLFLTFLGLLIAVYAILPLDRRVELRFRIGSIGILVTFMAFLSVLYLEFYDFFEAKKLAPSIKEWPTGINPNNATYLVIISLSVLIFIVYSSNIIRINRYNILRFKLATESLLWSNKYSELYYLLDHNIKSLSKVYRSDFALVHLKNKLSPSPLDRLKLRVSENGLEFHEQKPNRRKLNNVIEALVPIGSRFASLLPSYKRSKEIAHEIVNTIILSPEFIKRLSSDRPYFGIKILEELSDDFDYGEYLKHFMQSLMDNETSVIYREIYNNRNISGNNRYDIPETNRLLYYLFKDARIAEKLGIWEEVGNYALSEMDELARDPIADPYNRAANNFQEEGRWKSPLFIAIRWFDIMVTEALYQNVQWHMWLYYFPLFVSRIERNYRLSDPLVDPLAEWPTRYSYLLYEIFSAMENWIETLQYLPNDQDNTILENFHANHENGNIPKSAIIALSQCARDVVMSENIHDHFKSYLIDNVFELYYNLREWNKADYAIVLREAIKQGGGFKRSNDDEYHDTILSLLRNQRLETIIKHGVNEYDDLCEYLQDQ